MLFRSEKPQKYSFTPGPASKITRNRDGWTNEKRPFSFTSLPESDLLEFTIKTYPTLKGVNNERKQINKDNELILHDVFGTIEYKGEGIFIAGGAGVTPIICIFRYLQSKNETGGTKLIFANETQDDVILALEIKEILGENFINILSEELTGEYAPGQIGEKFLKESISGFDQQYSICGPPPMMDAIQKQLAMLSIDKNSISVDKKYKNETKAKREDHFDLVTSEFRQNLKTQLCETKEQTLK